jgi:L-alanine-DL-glutamate epimerase-like enolase superfamily enzyme
MQLIAAARAVGLSVMIGCEVETSLAITAAATLTCLADYADLDLHLWLDDDPYDGVQVKDGRFALPTHPGLGIREAAQSARTPQ